jgi:hypothetical protein
MIFLDIRIGGDPNRLLAKLSVLDTNIEKNCMLLVVNGTDVH